MEGNLRTNTAKATLFQPGNPGKPKGATNLLNRTVKDTVLAVFNRLQEDPKANLEAWAKKEPTEFYKIAAKLIPTEVRGNIDNQITLRVVRSSNPTTLIAPEPGEGDAGAEAVQCVVLRSEVGEDASE